MKNTIYAQVESLTRKHGTRDPFALLDALGAVTQFSDRYASDGLKGFCMILNRTRYVVINSKLSPEDQRVTAAHELGHLVMHGSELRCGAFRDSDIYQPQNRWEREANFYGADLLIRDSDVLELMREGNANFFTVAGALRVPCEFFAFKLYSMIERGLPMRMPVELDSNFLAGKRKTK